MTIRPTSSGETPQPGITRTGKTTGSNALPRQGTPSAPAPPPARQDDVQISAAARELQQPGVAAGGPSGELSPDRLREVLGRISSGYYDQPQVQAAVLKRVVQDL